jgi:hypothetical protein
MSDSYHVLIDLKTMQNKRGKGLGGGEERRGERGK